MANATNLLDFLLDFFACAEEEDLAEVLPASDSATLESLLDRLREYARDPWAHATPLADGELRPFVETSTIYDASPWARGGFAIGLHDLQSDAESWRVVDRIKQRLLYCHSVAADDPLWELASLAAS